MSYPEEIRRSLLLVEKTRIKRRDEKFPPLKPEDKENLLKTFHPDYKPGSFRPIRVGVNKGEMAVEEICSLLESYSYLEEKERIDRVDYQTDCLIIGGGGSGCMAALSYLKSGGRDCILVTKLRLGDSNTVMAQGGIQAATRKQDSPVAHYLDVMGGGGYKNIPELVETLVLSGPEIIAFLEEKGMMFDKKEDGEMVCLHGGGTSRKRLHTAKDYTGMEIMRILKDEVYNNGIRVFEFLAAIELLSTPDGECQGAVFLNLETRELISIQSKVTILATGGCGRLHVQGFPTSNHYGATGDGLVLANRIGAKVCFLDTIQYHPTGVAFPEQILGQLITEKVRGLGAQLVNSQGLRFIYELETRDCVASAIIKECLEGRGVKTPQGQVGVWLDTPLIEMKQGPGTIERELPAMLRQFLRFGIDIRKEPVLTYPTQHYQNGGVLINSDCETNVPGLLASGEVTGGVHGRNRLMGNSLLDILVFGRSAGRKAWELAQRVSFKPVGLFHLFSYHKELRDLGIPRNKVSPLILPDYRTKGKGRPPWE
uniref:FAD-binding protein n=1 Tax=candidate division WOR-3 bacterium TaxID=2052148 RepID=A0A7C3Z0X6_UNCW3